MSRQVRHRATAVLLGGLLLGGPLLTNGIANAGGPSDPPGQRSNPVQVTATPSESPTSPPPPISAIPVVPSRVIPDTGVRPRTNAKRATKVKTRTRHGTDSSAPILIGKPPPSRKASLRRVPTLDLPSPTESALAAPARPDAEIAAERVARTGPMSESGVIGLLAAVSMVLVLGVSAGLIRAIVSERASRTKIA